MNNFIHLGCKQFMKISHETIAPWPLFPHTFMTGASGNRILQQYLILGISKTWSEKLNSLQLNVSIPVLMSSERYLKSVQTARGFLKIYLLKTVIKLLFIGEVTLSIQDS